MLAASGLAAFSPSARLAVIRAGMTAADCGQRRLGDAFLLLALAEGEPLARPVERKPWDMHVPPTACAAGPATAARPQSSPVSWSGWSAAPIFQ
jgi:hypothetical protein